MKKLMLVLAFLLIATSALAQTITNPGHVEFTASLDHTLVTNYVIGYFATGATQPIQTENLGKPTPDATNKITASINIRPIGFGVDYTAKVKAVAGANESEWSDPSNPFNRAPETATNIVVKK